MNGFGECVVIGQNESNYGLDQEGGIGSIGEIFLGNTPKKEPIQDNIVLLDIVENNPFISHDDLTKKLRDKGFSQTGYLINKVIKLGYVRQIKSGVTGKLRHYNVTEEYKNVMLLKNAIRKVK